MSASHDVWTILAAPEAHRWNSVDSSIGDKHGLFQFLCLLLAHVKELQIFFWKFVVSTSLMLTIQVFRGVTFGRFVGTYRLHLPG